MILICKRCKQKLDIWLNYFADEEGWLRCGKNFLPHKPKWIEVEK